MVGETHTVHIGEMDNFQAAWELEMRDMENKCEKTIRKLLGGLLHTISDFALGTRGQTLIAKTVRVLRVAVVYKLGPER